MKQPRIHKIGNWLDQLIPYFSFIGIIIALFVAFAVYGISKDTNATAKNTQIVLTKQDQTLDAIKQLSVENKLTSKQLGDTIICMLLVPVGQRTTETQSNCEKQAVANPDTSHQTIQSEQIKSNPQTPSENNQPKQNAIEKLINRVQQGLSNIVNRGAVK